MATSWLYKLAVYKKNGPLKVLLCYFQRSHFSKISMSFVPNFAKKLVSFKATFETSCKVLACSEISGSANH